MAKTDKGETMTYGYDLETLVVALEKVEGAARDMVRKANEERQTCVRRLGAYCSPSDPRCRCYCDGRCVELELPEV